MSVAAAGGRGCRRMTVSRDDIVRRVAERTGCPAEVLRLRDLNNRAPEHEYRQRLVFALRQSPKAVCGPTSAQYRRSWPEIARFMGWSDHTTAMHAFRREAERRGRT